MGAVRGPEYLETLVHQTQEEEVVTPKKTGVLPILPDNQLKLFWDVVLIVSLVIYALIFPFAEHFLTDRQQMKYIFQYENAITCQFMLDIAINFITAYVDDNKRVITNRSLIFQHYFVSWFPLDLLSAFPFYLMTPSKETSYISYLKYIKLPRLFKLQGITRKRYRKAITKVSTYIYQVANKLGINMAIFSFLQLFMVIIIVNHYAACLYFGVTDRTASNKSWHSHFSNYDPNPSIVYYYVASMEWSFQTWTSVGYGELSPIQPREKLVCILWMILGVGFFYPYVLSSFNGLFKQLFYFHYLIDNIRAPINQSTKILKINQDLKDQINSFISQNEMMKTAAWLDSNNHSLSLPPPLKKLFFQKCYRNMIDKIPFLQKEINLSITILQECFFHRYEKNEYIYRHNDIANELYFIYHGNIKLCDSEGNNFIILNQGSYFGEAELVSGNNQRRRYFAQAKGDCLIMIYRKCKLLTLLKDFPIIRA